MSPATAARARFGSAAGSRQAPGSSIASQNVDHFSDGSPPVPAVFYAYNAKTGKELWNFKNNMGSTIRAAPMTFMVDGKQYIAIMMHSLINPSAPPGQARSFNPGSPTQAPVDHLTVFGL